MYIKTDRQEMEERRSINIHIFAHYFGFLGLDDNVDTEIYKQSRRLALCADKKNTHVIFSKDIF